MSIKIVVAVTDFDWFSTLRDREDLSEINFWSPSPRGFQALDEGELFLFKLHAPYNKIVGGAIFAYANTLPCSLAWEAFGEGNGATSLREMQERIIKHRSSESGSHGDFEIGCRILTQPFFLAEPEWMAPPPSWKPNIVSLKTFDSDTEEGRELWVAVQQAIRRSDLASTPEEARYGPPQLIKPRLGQGIFRVKVTELYRRSCAVTGERTLPALEAAHIVPYAEGGSHDANNGLLLRRDIHSLFDAGYVTVTPSLEFRVSKMIQEEFRNGRVYYALDRRHVRVPEEEGLQPAREALAWHNENRYRG